jgi:hypothetical protein
LVWCIIYSFLHLWSKLRGKPVQRISLHRPCEAQSAVAIQSRTSPSPRPCKRFAKPRGNPEKHPPSVVSIWIASLRSL